MPLLRQSLYSQNVNLYLAPTADGRDTWLPLMRTVASEGRCAVLSANQCMTKSNLPNWITGKKETNGDTHVNGHTLPPKLRRKSTITEDGNEIVLPGPKEEDSEAIENGHSLPPKRRRKSIFTDDGDEIVIPGSTVDTVVEEETSEVQRDPSEFVSRGGSCIVSPLGEVVAGPLWDDENGLLTVEVDFEDCLRGRLDLDVGGSYSRYVLRIYGLGWYADNIRNDSFKLTVEGLDLSPPP